MTIFYENGREGCWFGTFKWGGTAVFFRRPLLSHPPSLKPAHRASGLAGWVVRSQLLFGAAALTQPRLLQPTAGESLWKLEGASLRDPMPSAWGKQCQLSIQGETLRCAASLIKGCYRRGSRPIVAMRLVAWFPLSGTGLALSHALLPSTELSVHILSASRSLISSELIQLSLEVDFASRNPA